MKSFSVLKFLIIFSVFCAFFALEVKAGALRPSSVKEVKSCIAQKEANFGETPSLGSTADEMSVKEFEGQVAEIDGLIGCVNQGLKIPNLNWRIRRDWLIKKFEYYQMRQIFAQFSCYAKNVVQVDNLTTVTEKEVENNNKKAALRNVNLLQSAALRTKACIDRGIRFKHIDADFKEGFRAIAVPTDALLEKVEDLRATVKQMPE